MVTDEFSLQEVELHMKEECGPSDCQISPLNQQLLALQKMITAVSSHLDMQDVLDEAMSQAVNLTQGTAGSIWLIDESNDLKLRSLYNLTVQEAEKIDGFLRPLVLEIVTEKGQPVVSNDVATQPGLAELPALRKLVRSFVSLPMVIGKSVIGIVNVYHADRAKAFDDNAVWTLTLLIGHTVVVLGNAWLYSATAESEKRYRSVFEGNLEGIVLIDADSGQIVEANQAFWDTLGYSKKELEDTKFWELRAQGQEDAARQEWLELIRSGQARGRAVPFRAKDGRAVDVEFSSQLITLADRQVVVWFGRDVTETTGLQNQLRHSQKMEAIGNLASGIAHDFNNILSSILGYALYLKGTLEKDDFRQSDLEVIAQSVRQGSDLTSQLLTFARGEPHKLEMVDLNEVIQEIILLLTHTIDKSIMITPVLEEELAVINGDRSQLRQLVLNLCLNACDAMTEGGSLTLRTQTVWLEPEATLQELNKKTGNYILLSISDTGHGMDSQTMEHIFEPFFSTKREHADDGKHSGLGLATVFGIVKGHGGIIRVQSVLGRGTTFRIWLPAEEISSAGRMERESDLTLLEVANLPLGKGETVMVVEDETYIRELLARILEGHNYRVILAKDGLDALELFERNKDQVDLVILDMVLPEMSGTRVFAQMREIDPDLSVVVVSGNAEWYQTKEITKTGVKGFIQKPFTLQCILEEVRAILDDKN